MEHITRDTKSILMDRCYLAGFFDGEGNVGIYKGGGTGRTLRVQITQTVSPNTDELFNGLKERWGGSVSTTNKRFPRQVKIYQCSGENAASFLIYVRDNLVFKKQQAELALLWFENRPALVRDPATGRRLPRSKDDIARTEEVADMLKHLKKDSMTPEDEFRLLNIEAGLTLDKDGILV